MHSPASAPARVEARPGIGISAFRRFLPVVSTQTFARNLAVFVMFLSLFELYKFSTLLHRSTFVFSAFRALPPFFQILQAPPHPSRSFPKIAYRLVGRPKRCKMPSNAFLFCYNRCRSRCPRAKGQRAEESATQPSFSIFFSFFYFSFLRFFFLRAFGYDPQERFFSSAFPGRSGHRGPSRFFLADCSLRSFVRAGLGNMLFRRARWVVVTARV